MGCDGGPWGSSDVGGENYEVYWDDGGDYESSEVEDGGEHLDIDGESDATEGDGDVVDYCTVGDRTGITNYARITCNPNNMIIANGQIFGMCTNQLFACPAGTSPTTCSEAVTMPVAVDLEGATLSVTTTRIVNLGGRLLALYGADDAATGKSASGLMLINPTTYEVLQHVVMVTTSYGSGSDPITLTPRQPTYAVDGNRLYVSTANQNPSSHIYEPGFFFALPKTTAGEIDQRNLGDTTVTFGGRNMQRLALLDNPGTPELDNNMLWAYSPSGPPATIPFSTKIEIYVMNNRPDMGIARPLSSPVEIRRDRIPIMLDPLPGEPTGPAIIPYDVSDAANPQRIDVDADTNPDAINIADVYLGDQMLVVGDYGIAASGASATLHMANLGSPTTAVVSRDMSSRISGTIVSIAYSGMRVFVVSDSDGPNFHGIDVPFTSASEIGGGVYVGSGAGASVCDTGGDCFIAVESACETGNGQLVRDDTSVTAE